MSKDIRLSVSKTKTFLSCKRKYKFSYVDKMPSKVWDHHTIGKFCHKVLEDFHNDYINGSDEPYNIVITRAFKESKILFSKDLNKDIIKECWEIINNYLKLMSQDREKKLVRRVLACEKSFELPVIGENKIILNGMIDRIQIDGDNVLHVADYKTTKNKKYLQDDWFQLMTYGLIMINEDPSLKVIRASYILLRHDFEHLTKEFTSDELLSLKDKYLDYAEQILNEKEFPPSPSFLCKYCDFASSCEEGAKIVTPSQTFGEVSW